VCMARPSNRPPPRGDRSAALLSLSLFPTSLSLSPRHPFACGSPQTWSPRSPSTGSPTRARSASCGSSKRSVPARPLSAPRLVPLTLPPCAQLKLSYDIVEYHRNWDTFEIPADGLEDVYRLKRVRPAPSLSRSSLPSPRSLPLSQPFMPTSPSLPPSHRARPFLSPAAPSRPLDLLRPTLTDLRAASQFPMLVIEDADKGFPTLTTLAESGAIFDTLVDLYGSPSTLSASATFAPLVAHKYRFWSHWVEGTAMYHLVFFLILVRSPYKFGFATAWMARFVCGAIISAFILPNLKKTFSFMEEELGDNEYFVGGQFTACDILVRPSLSFFALEPLEQS